MPVANHSRHEPVSRQLSDWLPDTATEVEATALRRVELDDLWRLVEKLPLQQRVAMTLRFRDDRSAREAAAVMGKSEAAVKVLLSPAVGRPRSQGAGTGDWRARTGLALCWFPAF